MLSTDYDHLSDGKQMLGERLYGQVEELCPRHASHVTGILLEAGNQEVMRMLQDETLLERRVEGAMRVINDECADQSQSGTHGQHTFDKDGLATRLYLKVQEIEPQHRAKVTGMLLELDPDTITNLLSSPQDLVRAVQKATTTLLSECPEGQSCYNEIDEEKQDLGEELYSIIEETHPELASKLTGMLLEMDVVCLRELLDHPSKLNEKVQLALDALRKAAAVTW